MALWTVWFSDFPLMEDEKVLLFGSQDDALAYAKDAHWGERYLSAIECKISDEQLCQEVKRRGLYVD